MFQLTQEEWNDLKNIVETTERSMSSQFVMTYPAKRTNAALPYAFTEHGVALLSGVLNSGTAIQMNIAIMRAFVEIRQVVFRQLDLRTQLFEIKQRLGEHDVQLNQIFQALENLLDKKAAQRKWDSRERIGFKR